MSDNIPQIKPIKVTEYETKQSKYGEILARVFTLILI